MISDYIGHPSQLCGVEEVILSKGKGKGMTLLNIRNGKGIEMTLSPDRCMDISRLSLKGDNIGYFAPCGYVAPTFYDKEGIGFLKSFTAGFLTTCGLSSVGSPATDGDESLPMHGKIGNTPCEEFYYNETESEICIIGKIRDASLFGASYLMTRKYTISKERNIFEIRDTVKNIGNITTPCMILYHINIGYPMLSEKSELYIPHSEVKARNSHAEESIKDCLLMEKPQAGYEECCYYYDVAETDGISSVGIYNPDIAKGVRISYEKAKLNFFTEWKMMGIGEYVLGLEPGNCTPDGREAMRKIGELKELAPGEEYSSDVKFLLSEDREIIKCTKKYI